MKTFKFTTEISISEEALELLKKVDKEGYAEYRDREYNTYEDYVNGKKSLGIENIRSEESFNRRNFGGTWCIMAELVEADLVEWVGESWHTTYKVGEWGRKVLDSLKINTYDLEREIDFIKHEVDFVPDDLADYKNKLSSSDFKKIEKAFAYRKKHFDDMTDSKRKFYE